MKIRNFLIKSVISPHGITDLSHSISNNLYPTLFKIQAVTIISSAIANSNNLSYLTDTAFLVSSIYHFRNDFTDLNINNFKIPKIITSALFIISCILYDKFLPYELGIDTIVLFMTLFHVPNHYKNNWKHIQKEPLLNFFIITFFTAFVNGATTLNPQLIFDSNAMTLIKSITISHIIYSEIYVRDKKV
jgi:hypothetical protein